MDQSKIRGLVLLITLIAITVYVFFYFQKQNKKDRLIIEKEKEKKRKELEEFKLSKPKEYAELEEKKAQKSQQKKLYNRARLGALIFVVPHFLFEAMFSELGQPTYGPAINLGITLIILRNRIISNNKKYDNPLVQGLIVSSLVFLVRVILGMIAISSGLIG